MLHEKILELKNKLMESAHLAESSLQKVIDGINGHQKDLLAEVLRHDEQLANDFERKIDESGINLAARYQPEAVDLRTILMILRINNDLERMMDHICNMAESALVLIKRPSFFESEDLLLMAGITKNMLQDSISAFIRHYSPLGEDVCRRDEEVDHLIIKIFKNLVKAMTADKRIIEHCLHVIRIAHNLERIADLSTNIGEDVVFMVEGRVIKHHYRESPVGE